MIARAWAATVAFAVLALPAPAKTEPDLAWGPAVNGLRIGLATTAHPERHRGVALELQLENTSGAPLRLPGRLRLPWSWRFEFESEAGGPALIAHFAQPPEPPEPPLPIELAVGERQPLRFDCRHWLHAESHTIARPRPGLHVVRAGSLPVGAEPDPRAWTGEARSGRVTVEISFRD